MKFISQSQSYPETPAYMEIYTEYNPEFELYIECSDPNEAPAVRVDICLNKDNLKELINYLSELENKLYFTGEN